MADLDDNEIYFEFNNTVMIPTDKIKIYGDLRFKNFIKTCENIKFSVDSNEDEIVTDDILFNNVINSNYYDLQELNKIKIDPSTLGIMHTNIASLNAHRDELELILSIIKFDFQIIGITEHKISDLKALSNITISGYQNFVYTPTKSTHGGTGFYVKDNINFKRRVDLELIPPGPKDFESTFIEIIIPNKRNIVACCIYRHPPSLISIEEFTKNYLDPVLQKLSSENKICTLMGDFNINLLQTETHAGNSYFYNTMLSNFFAPYILQPTRPVSKSLIDNIFFDTIDYPSKSGNLKIQLADHLLQFALLEDFFQPYFQKNITLKKEISNTLMRENSRKPLITLIYIIYFN